MKTTIPNPEAHITARRLSNTRSILSSVRRALRKKGHTVESSVTRPSQKARKAFVLPGSTKDFSLVPERAVAFCPEAEVNVRTADGKHSRVHIRVSDDGLTDSATVISWVSTTPDFKHAALVESTAKTMRSIVAYAVSLIEVALQRAVAGGQVVTVSHPPATAKTPHAAWTDPKCGCERSPDVSTGTPCPEHVTAVKKPAKKRSNRLFLKRDTCVIVYGPPATGKTRYARAFAERYGRAYDEASEEIMSASRAVLRSDLAGSLCTTSLTLAELERLTFPCPVKFIHIEDARVACGLPPRDIFTKVFPKTCTTAEIRKAGLLTRWKRNATGSWRVQACDPTLRVWKFIETQDFKRMQREGVLEVFQFMKP